MFSTKQYATWKDGGWTERGTYLGTNKKGFDAENFAVLRVARLLHERNERGRSYTIFADPQAAAERVRHVGCGSAQVLARATLVLAQEIHERGGSVTVRWVPAHSGVEGNEHADCTAK